MNKVLSEVKDVVAKRHGYADWLQIDMAGSELREEIKAGLLDEVATAYKDAIIGSIELSFERLKEGVESLKDVLFLDGVLAVIDSVRKNLE